MDKKFKTAAKLEIFRRGKEVIVKVIFNDDYEAMGIFDLWSDDQLAINMSFSGPRLSHEEESL